MHTFVGRHKDPPRHLGLRVELLGRAPPLCGWREVAGEQTAQLAEMHAAGAIQLVTAAAVAGAPDGQAAHALFV